MHLVCYRRILKRTKMNSSDTIKGFVEEIRRRRCFASVTSSLAHCYFITVLLCMPIGMATALSEDAGKCLQVDVQCMPSAHHKRFVDNIVRCSEVSPKMIFHNYFFFFSLSLALSKIRKCYDNVCISEFAPNWRRKQVN